MHSDQKLRERPRTASNNNNNNNETWVRVVWESGLIMKCFRLTSDTRAQNTTWKGACVKSSDEHSRGSRVRDRAQPETKGYVHVVFFSVCLGRDVKQRELQSWQCTRGTVYWRDQNRERERAQPREQQRDGRVRAKLLPSTYNTYACEYVHTPAYACVRMRVCGTVTPTKKNAKLNYSKLYLPIVLSFSGNRRCFRFLSGKLVAVW